jgi:hypothetical protein
MWVFCCGMIRSGSTVQYHLTKDIVEVKMGGVALGAIVEPHEFSELYDQHAHTGGTFVIKCHEFVPDAIPLFEGGEAKAVYVYRDIRDVIVSHLWKTRTAFRETTVRKLLHSMLAAYYEWNNLGDILVSEYEEMVADLKQEALRIAEYLGIDISESFALELAKKYSIEQQKRRIQSFDYQSGGVRVGPHLYDPVTLLHDNHIRSGKCGQWMTELSPLQVGLIEEVAHDWMTDRGYSISQSWFIRKCSLVNLHARRIWRRARKLWARRLVRGRRVAEYSGRQNDQKA